MRNAGLYRYQHVEVDSSLFVSERISGIRCRKLCHCRLRSVQDCIYSVECINKQYTQSHHRWSQFAHTPSSSLLLLKQMPTALTCPLQVITTIDNSVRLYNIPFPPSLHNNHNYIGWKIASQFTIHFLSFFFSLIYLPFPFNITSVHNLSNE